MGAERVSKWWLVGAYWAIQAAAIYFITPLWIASATNVEPSTGNMGRFSWSDYVHELTSVEWTVWALSVIPVITIAQLVFVWPLRKPAAKNARGWPIKMSLGVAGLGVAILGTAFLWAICQAINALTGFDIGTSVGVRYDPVIVAIVWCVASWGAATPLLIRFCKRGPRESLLARVASRIFVGTVVEMAAIIPLDVIVRKRESCYCLAGTYFAMLMCGAVGIVVLGPAVLLPVLARRRKRWYEGKCEWCAYDMTSTPRAERCPECGMGWRGEGSGKGAEGHRGKVEEAKPRE